MRLAHDGASRSIVLLKVSRDAGTRLSVQANQPGHQTPLEWHLCVLGTVPDAGATSDKTTHSLVGETRQKIVTEVTVVVPVVRKYGPGRVKCFSSVTGTGKTYYYLFQCCLTMRTLGAREVK